MSKKKNTTKKSKKSGEALRKAALAETQANIARIEAQERGEKPAERDTTTLAKFFPHPGRGKGGKAAAKNAKASKPAKAKAPKEKKPKRMSALDAAAKVLVESKEPMNAQAIIKAMADKGLWTSPKGKTPNATIYAAMVREIKDRGRTSRFIKRDRGQFAANAKAGA